MTDAPKHHQPRDQSLRFPPSTGRKMSQAQQSARQARAVRDARSTKLAPRPTPHVSERHHRQQRALSARCNRQRDVDKGVKLLLQTLARRRSGSDGHNTRDRAKQPAAASGPRRPAATDASQQQQLPTVSRITPWPPSGVVRQQQPAVDDQGAEGEVRTVAEEDALRRRLSRSLSSAGFDASLASTGFVPSAAASFRELLTLSRSNSATRWSFRGSLSLMSTASASTTDFPATMMDTSDEQMRELPRFDVLRSAPAAGGPPDPFEAAVLESTLDDDDELALSGTLLSALADVDDNPHEPHQLPWLAQALVTADEDPDQIDSQQWPKAAVEASEPHHQQQAEEPATPGSEGYRAWIEVPLDPSDSHL